MLNIFVLIHINYDIIYIINLHVNIKILNLYNIIQISLADLRILALFQFYDAFGIKYDESKYVELTQIKEHLLAEPKLKEWVKNRPVTEF